MTSQNETVGSVSGRPTQLPAAGAVRHDPVINGRRLLFVCPSIEPGRSGVGDYTVGLAGAVCGLGQYSKVLAFADPGVETVQKATMTVGQELLETIRIPVAAEASALRCLVTQELEEYAADWISIQWVPYAFHPKGWAALGKFPWEALAGRTHLHWMVHETWVGDHVGASFKRRFIGLIQRKMMQRLAAKLRVKLIHTTNPAYLRQLSVAGLHAHELPLFGSLDCAAGAEWKEWASVLPEPVGRAVDADRGSYWMFCFFGTIHDNYPAREVFDAIHRATVGENRRSIILSLGHSGGGGALFQEWQRTFGQMMQFIHLGCRSDEQTVAVLSRADFGLSSTPHNIIGKSSAAAALAEQGLPVLVGARGAAVCGEMPSVRAFAPRFWLAEDFLANRLYLTEARPPRGSRLGEVSRQFLRDVESAEMMKA